MIINRRDAITTFAGIMIMAIGALIGGWVSTTIDPSPFFKSTPIWWDYAKNIFIVIGSSLTAVGYWIPYKIFLEKWVQQGNCTCS